MVQDGAEFRFILAHSQLTLKKTIAICHIVNVAS
jgi:hypothetical protein